jgi:hydrogenase expression/formation protein HypC
MYRPEQSAWVGGFDPIMVLGLQYRNCPLRLFMILLQSRDQGACAARNPHVCQYIPVSAPLFTLLTVSCSKSRAGSCGRQKFASFQDRNISMCLSVPMRIISCDGDRAIADTLGVSREISLALLGEPVPQPGDYVVVHVGYAIERIDEAAAEETLAIWQEMQENGSHA